LPYFGEVTHLCMPLNMVSMAIYVTLEGKIPRTPFCFSVNLYD